MRVSEYIKFFKNHNGRNMAFFENQSWQLIEKLEFYCGFWLHQSRLVKYLIRVGSIVLLTSPIVPITARLLKEWGINLRITVENINCILATIGVLMKIIMAYVYTKKRQEIYEKVNDHFRTITDSHEAFILNRAAKRGMKFWIKYLMAHILTFIIFIVSCTLEMIFKYSVNKGNFEKIYPYAVDYSFVDEDKYYPLIILQILAASTIFALSNLAYDSGFIMTTRHACTLFEVVKSRLREASGFLEKYEWDILDFTTADKKAYEIVTQAIDLHNVAFDITSSIEGTYSIPMFGILLESAFIFSGGIYVLLNLTSPFEFLRYFTLFLGMFIQYSVIFSHGQMIIDSSSSVFDACYDVKWYVASPKTRRLLFIMMLRSSRPSEITGGGFFVLSMGTYTKMTKGGYSYLSIFNRH